MTCEEKQSAIKKCEAIVHYYEHLAYDCPTLRIQHEQLFQSLRYFSDTFDEEHRNLIYQALELIDIYHTCISGLDDPVIKNPVTKETEQTADKTGEDYSIPRSDQAELVRPQLSQDSQTRASESCQRTKYPLTGPAISLDSEHKVEMECREIILEDAYLLWTTTEVKELIGRFHKSLEQFGANRELCLLIQQCLAILKMYLKSNCEKIVNTKEIPMATEDAGIRMTR
jgi:hypothetical protein